MKKLVLSLLAILLIATPAMAQRAKVDPVLPGETFPGAVFDNFNLTFEPNYRHSIIPISNSLNTRSGFMLQTGFRYMIR